MSILTNQQIREGLVAELTRYRMHLVQAMIAEMPRLAGDIDIAPDNSTLVFSGKNLADALTKGEDAVLSLTIDEKLAIMNSKRGELALEKYNLVVLLIKTLPSAEESANLLIRGELFQSFAAKFHAVRPALEALRRNDNNTDNYLVPFLKAVAGILLCLTIVFAPLAYFGLWRTTGQNCASNIARLIKEEKVFEGPKKAESVPEAPKKGENPLRINSLC